MNSSSGPYRGSMRKNHYRPTRIRASRRCSASRADHLFCDGMIVARHVSCTERCQELITDSRRSFQFPQS